jgi:adenosylcobyric acid synthase
MGCYLHGLFSADAFRAAFLAQLDVSLPLTNYTQGGEDTLYALAYHLETHMDIDALLGLAGPV